MCYEKGFGFCSQLVDREYGETYLEGVLVRYGFREGRSRDVSGEPGEGNVPLRSPLVEYSRNGYWGGVSDVSRRVVLICKSRLRKMRKRMESGAVE